MIFSVNKVKKSRRDLPFGEKRTTLTAAEWRLRVASARDPDVGVPSEAHRCELSWATIRRRAWGWILFGTLRNGGRFRGIGREY